MLNYHRYFPIGTFEYFNDSPTLEVSNPTDRAGILEPRDFDREVPYSADDFSLSAQLSAGVPLKSSPLITGVNRSSIVDNASNLVTHINIPN